MSLPRILTGAGPSRMSYTDHLRHHGELPAVALTDGSGRRGSAGRGDDGTAPPLLLELARSGLRGRGGAASHWRARSSRSAAPAANPR